MARTDYVTTHKFSSQGLALVAEAANVDGNSFPNNTKKVVYVNNASGGSINVTAVTPQVVDGNLAVADRVVAVPASTFRLIGPFDAAAYSQPDGKVNIDYSAVTSVTATVIEWPF